jgi:hypothetical protein
VVESELHAAQNNVGSPLGGSSLAVFGGSTPVPAPLGGFAFVFEVSSSSKRISNGFGSAGGDAISGASVAAGRAATGGFQGRALRFDFGFGGEELGTASARGGDSATGAVAAGGGSGAGTGAITCTGAGAAACDGAPLLESHQVSSEAAAADPTDDRTTRRLAECGAERKLGAEKSRESSPRGGAEGVRLRALSVVIGASVSSGAGAGEVERRGAPSGSKSKLIVAAGRSYTASTSASSVLGGGGSVGRGAGLPCSGFEGTRSGAGPNGSVERPALAGTGATRGGGGEGAELGARAGGELGGGRTLGKRAASFSCGTLSTGAHSCIPARQTSDRSSSLRARSASTTSIMLMGTTTASLVLTSHSPGAVEIDTVTASSPSVGFSP